MEMKCGERLSLCIMHPLTDFVQIMLTKIQNKKSPCLQHTHSYSQDVTVILVVLQDI
jgi:hypothetical protein